MITVEKIKVFDSFNGDIDGYLRTDRKHQDKLFEDNEWLLIDSFYQDVELINKALVDETYIEQVIVDLKEKFDEDSFEMLVGKFDFYKDFQNVADILIRIKSYLSSESDVIWAGQDNADEFIEGLNKDIQHIQNCSFIVLSDIYAKFLPTGTYQEISISNGWGNEYIILSLRFEKIHSRLIQRKVKINTPPQIGKAWWQKLFSGKKLR